jgi:hypothetical protein
MLGCKEWRLVKRQIVRLSKVLEAIASEADLAFRRLDAALSVISAGKSKVQSQKWKLPTGKSILLA